jgi:hypothetical protein
LARGKQFPTIATVSEALDLLRVDQLKQLLSLLPTKERPTKKEGLIALIERHLSGEQLRALWEQLDETQKLAVAETIYSAEGAFNADRFKAKYGQLPVFGTKKEKWGHWEDPSPLRLFIYAEDRWSSSARIVPEDLKQRLLSFVSKPSAPVLPSTDQLPEHFELAEKEYEWRKGDEGITVVMGKRVYLMPHQKPEVKIVTHQIPLTRRETATAAQQDLLTVLRLIDKGKVAVSDKTFQPSSATMEEIASLLHGGDFYEPAPPQRGRTEIGPIKAFAWPLLVQAARLAEPHGKKLALTKAGRDALSAPPAETLRLIWQRWLKAKLLDEFNRIDSIKGQQGKGKRSMTAVGGRRAVIAEALKKCPVGSWVKFDDFARFMRAANFDFEVTRQPWELYISDPHYGSLGYEGYHEWEILQGRYTLCLLFEHAATLGLIDVAYLEPAGVRKDFRDIWGSDDLEFLSRYDGLIYFRLNPLGAYCLGLTEEYVPAQKIQVRAALRVLPSLRVYVLGEALSPDEALLLETYAEKESDELWQLSREKALIAVESGHQIAELREFLQSRDEQPLPETVESFILTTERRAQALRLKGQSLLIECADAEIAELIARDERTKKLCLRAGERHLVVPLEAEEQFRKALHLLDYGMPRV